MFICCLEVRPTWVQIRQAVFDPRPASDNNDDNDDNINHNNNNDNNNNKHKRCSTQDWRL